MIELLHVSSQSLMAIVSDVLDFSKIGERRLEIERIAFELKQPLRENACDLVLMDLHMPGKDGLATTRELRQLAEQGQLRVHPDGLVIVAFTADTSPETLNACQAVGMQGFLSKPIQIAELRSILNQHLSSES